MAAAAAADVEAEAAMAGVAYVVARAVRCSVGLDNVRRDVADRAGNIVAVHFRLLVSNTCQKFSFFFCFCSPRAGRDERMPSNERNGGAPLADRNGDGGRAPPQNVDGHGRSRSPAGGAGGRGGGGVPNGTNEEFRRSEE